MYTSYYLFLVPNNNLFIIGILFNISVIIGKTIIVPINESEDYDKDKYDYIFLNDKSYINEYMLNDYEVIDTEKYILLERRE